MRFPARILFCLLLVVSSLLLVAHPAFAQTNETVPPNTHNYVQTVMLDTMAALTCQLTGIDPAGGGKKCLGYNPQTGELGFVENGNGAIGAMGGMIAVLYNPPLSSSDYFRYLARNFGIAKPVYAEGKSGFDGLKPLLPVWTVFRNLVYVLFAVAFVLVGLAIMLRVRIDPRTVMTIQNQIPKLIIALLLVTFSYAIAGLLVDLMYVVIFLLFGIVKNISLSGDTPARISAVQQNFQGQNPLGILNDLIGFRDIVSTVARSVIDTLGNLLGLSGLEGLANFPVVGGIFTTIAGAIPFLIIAIAVLWSLFRLWFQLIMAYVMLLIDVVFAPFWILVGVLPGTPVGFGAWLRSILSNLSPFPVTIGMFLLAKIFMESFRKLPNAFMPPLIGNPGTEAQSALASFIGLGFILLTPQVVAMTKDFLKAPVFKYMPAIGQAVGVGPGVIGSTTTAVVSPFGALAMFRNVRGIISGTGESAGGIRGLFGATKKKLEETEVKTKKQED